MNRLYRIGGGHFRNILKIDEIFSITITMGRPDGKPVKGLSKIRKIMPLTMPTRNESVIYYKYDVRAEKAEELVKRLNSKWDMKVTLFNIVIHSLFKAMIAYPGANRFVSGGRIYERNGVHFSFSVKRQFTTKASMTVVKKEFKPEYTLKDTVKMMSKDIRRSRKNRKNPSDKEAGRWHGYHPFLFHPGFKVYKFIDNYLGLLPKKWIFEDPFYATAFFANVGPFGMEGFYHHLYEHGNTPYFLVIGCVKESPIVEDGKVTVGRILPINMSVDERVNDGFYLNRALNCFVKNIEEPDLLLEKAEFIE